MAISRSVVNGLSGKEQCVILVFRGRNTRVWFLIASLAFAVIAIYLQSDEQVSTRSYTATGVYQSDLLDEEVRVSTLAALAYTEDFRNLVGGVVEVEDVPESEFHIRVTTSVADEPQLLRAHKRAIHLLTAEMKDTALSSVKSSLDYLDDVRQKAAALKTHRLNDEAQIALSQPDPKPAAEVLSSKDSQRVLFLREEINKVESFLDGGKLPSTVRVRLDRDSLNAAEERVRNQQQEAGRLAKIFHPTSKAVQAQRVSLEEAKSDLLEVERQLAEIYLRGLRVELETLDDKASGRIRDNLSAQKGKSDSGQVSSSGGASSAWLDDRQKQLEDRVDVISEAASLELDGKLTFSQVQSSPYSWTMVCWLASLACFLSALFSSQSSPVEPTSSSPEQKEPRREFRTAPRFRLELPQARTELSPDRVERFFDNLCAEVSKTLRRSPRRLLVLGDAPVEARLAFSIRLANSLGRDAGRVRLIDFDFQSKSLSERLGREELPGVSELMLQGGPVDEFFSSIAGTRIQFAPAGKYSAIEEESVQSERLAQILGLATNEVTIIDGSSASPLHLLVNQIDAVFWATRGSDSVYRSEREREVLVALRDAGHPIWGVSVETTEFFPLL